MPKDKLGVSFAYLSKLEIEFTPVFELKFKILCTSNFLGSSVFEKLFILFLLKVWFLDLFLHLILISLNEFKNEEAVLFDEWFNSHKFREVFEWFLIFNIVGYHDL